MVTGRATARVQLKAGLFESALYPDAELHGDQVIAGPFTFINTVAHAGRGGGPAMVLRTTWHLKWDLDATVNTTNDSGYVGRSSDDELAALMSRHRSAAARRGESSETGETTTTSDAQSSITDNQSPIKA